jgi:hypothetical protein
MSIRKFKPLALICLPALLFALIYTISLNASDSTHGDGYKCVGTQIGSTTTGYTTFGGGKSKKCGNMSYDECLQGNAIAHAFSDYGCVTGTSQNYCKEKEVPYAHGKKSCVYDSGCGDPDVMPTKNLTDC